MEQLSLWGVPPGPVETPRTNYESFLLNNIRHLFKQIGEPGHCQGCGREIVWIVHRNGRRAPYTLEGLNHFADCPKADLFKGGAS